MRQKPTPPEHLDEAGRQKWAEVYAILNKRGDTLDTGTLDALSAYASAWPRWTAAEAKVSELGAVIRSAAGFACISPFVGVAKDAQRQMRQWGDVLQLHRQARRAKAAKPAEAEGQGTLLRLLSGKAG
jgi:P27 family predicted phage terminase small subunit